MPSKPPGWRHSARFTGEDRDSRAEGRVQGSSITKLKSTEVFSYFFFFLLGKKKSISNYPGKSKGSQSKIKPGSGQACMLQSCCAKASPLWPASHFAHVSLGAGTPAVFLPPALTDPRPWQPGQPRGGRPGVSAGPRSPPLLSSRAPCASFGGGLCPASEDQRPCSRA